MTITTKKHRISRVIKELNISFQTAIDFLEEKKISEETLSPNSKIDQEVYELLSEHFAEDRERRERINVIYQKKREEREAIFGSSEETDSFSKIGPPVQNDITDQTKTQPRRDPSSPPKEEGLVSNKLIRKTGKLVGFKDLSSNKPTSGKSDTKEKSEEIKEPAKETVDKANTKKATGINLTGKAIDLDKINKKEKSVRESRQKKEDEEKEQKPLRKRRRFNPRNPGFSSTASVDQVKSGKPLTKIVEDEVSEEDISKKVNETLIKLTASQKGLGAKHRSLKRAEERKAQKKLEESKKGEKQVIQVTEYVTVSQLASLLDTTATDVIAKAMSNGIMATMNQRLNPDELEYLGLEYDVEIEFKKSDVELGLVEQDDVVSDLVERAPIVTVMGHVDHGKTSLLDYIRQENVIAGEAGGITQRIGSYKVELSNNKEVTFIDTPGHHTFTAMRARGGQVSDLVIIVIAADDDIQPQTLEAINHAQAADVPIIFAINKIDRPTADPDKVRASLSQRNFLVEELGGSYQSQEISALKGTGVDELLEKVLLQAELSELKANPKRLASGTVLDASLDKGRGFLTLLLVQNGTLKQGDYILAGSHNGKVKAIFDERGNRLKVAPPSTPVSILGLDGAPHAGDPFAILDDEREAKSIASGRKQLDREQILRTQKHITLDEIGRRIKIGNFQVINVVLKGDVDGSVEALSDSIEQLSTPEIELKIIHKGVGAITESDVLLASASDAIVIGFNLRPTGNVRILAEKEKIDVRYYSIIYDAIEDIKDAMEGMLSPELKEETTGTAEIRETYKISRLGTIAGCMVISGKIFKNGNIRVLRDGVVKYSGEIVSLKRFKDDVKDVSKGYDCGIQIKGFNDLKVGDQLEGFQKKEVRKTINAPA